MKNSAVVRATVVSTGPKLAVVEHNGLQHVLFRNTCCWVGSQCEMPWLGQTKFAKWLPRVGADVVFIPGWPEMGHKGIKAFKWSPAEYWDRAMKTIHERDSVMYRVSAKERFDGQFTTGNLPGGFRQVAVGTLSEIRRDNPIGEAGDPLVAGYSVLAGRLVREMIRWERKEGEEWVTCDDPFHRPPFRHDGYNGNGGNGNGLSGTNGSAKSAIVLVSSSARTVLETPVVEATVVQSSVESRSASAKMAKTAQTVGESLSVEQLAEQTELEALTMSTVRNRGKSRQPGFKRSMAVVPAEESIYA